MNDSSPNVPKIHYTADPKFVQDIKLGKPLDYSCNGLRTVNSKNKIMTLYQSANIFALLSASTGKQRFKIIEF